jgi:hypothetical protein
MILDDEDRVFLVKHSYVHGWRMPGGDSAGDSGRLTAPKFTGECDARVLKQICASAPHEEYRGERH